MAFDLSMPILVVDDYKTMIRIIRNLLKQIGFENVDEATDGTGAREIKSKKFGLIISDWNMEPMTGIGTAASKCAPTRISQDALHHDHRRIKNRKRHRRQESGRQQLYRQALQCRNARNQDEGRIPGLTGAEAALIKSEAGLQGLL